jgi:ubiquinone/menaquinone biosynthesis C-methylase UbiE
VKGGKLMVIDKSLRYYGKVYHLFIDPLLNEERANIINLIPENSTVLDAGCGTGMLSFLLREKKNCKVVGADLSLRMIDFANKSNNYKEIEFLHMDIGNINAFGKNHFDYSIMCQVIHELPEDKRINVIKELMRVGRKTIILDSNIPLPKNVVGLVIRMIDATIGRDHYDNFKSYISSGGIIGILERSGLTSHITQRIVFKSNCQQIVLLDS